MKENKAITLIALIITIIILSILAGITINMVVGDTGIINKAQIAKEKTNNADKKEEEELAKLENILQNYKTGNGTTSRDDETEVYDEEEKAIGTWIDGRTIYRKVFVFENATQLSRNWTNLFDISSLNISQLINKNFIPAETESNNLLGPILEYMIMNNYITVELEGQYRSSYTVPKDSALILEYVKKPEEK